MKVTVRGLAIAGAIGLLFWVVDTFLDYLLFYRESFWDLLILHIPPHELYTRTAAIVGLVIFAIIAGHIYRKRLDAEAHLRSREEWIATVLDSIGDGVITVDVLGVVTFINPVAQSLTGWSAAEAVGRPLADVFTIFDEAEGGEDKQSAGKISESDGDAGWKGVTVLIAKDGSRKPVVESNAIICSGRGEAVGAVLVFHDITRLREARQALQRSEETLRRVIDLVPHMIFATAQDGRFILANRATAEPFGIQPQEMLGTVPERLTKIIPEFGNYLKDDLEVINSGMRRFIPEESFTLPDGTVKILQTTKIPFTLTGSDQKAVLGVAIDITDLTQARKALQRAEHEKEVILDSLVEKVVYVDLDLNIIWANDAACKVWGASRSEVVGRGYRKMRPYAGQDKADCPVRLAMDSNTPVSVEMTSPDGRSWHIRAYPIVDHEGKIMGGVEVTLNVTEQRRAVVELRESRRMLGTLMSNLPGMAYRCLNDCDWTMEFVSEGCLGLTGYEAEDFIGNRKLAYNDIIHPDDREYVWTIIQEALSVPRPFQIEYRIITAKGDEKWVWEQGRGVFSSDGTLQALEGIISDISDRKRAQERLADERRRLDVTLRSIGDAVIATDIAGRVLVFNAQAEALTGYSEGEALGRPLTDVFTVIDEESETPRENPVGQVLQAGDVVNMSDQTVLISRGGQRRLVSDSGAPIKDDEGQIIGVVLVFRDVTETRRLQELAVRAQRLETAGRIAGQVAHDFNNLLGPLMAYPELIREELPADHPAVEYIEDIERSAEQIADINMQLLTLGRRGHYNLEILNLNEIVRQAIRQRSPWPEGTEAAIDLADDLMPIKGGPSQMFRVVANLIANALESMRDGGRLSIKTENYYSDKMGGVHGRIPKGEYVKLTVTDTGAGIPGAILPKIFDPFFTTKTTDRQKGSGLGLSVVHAVVEDHDGHIDFESDPERGTVFYVYFPVSRERPEARIPATAVTGGAESILVVDDDAVQRDVCIKLLSRLGYRTRAAESGEKAIEMLREEGADLLILDMIMPPGMDGADTYREACRIHESQKAIIVSGYAESDRVDLALKQGAGAFLKKPLRLKSLADAVREELDRKAVRR